MRTDHDFELLQAYLDGGLGDDLRATLEERLKAEPGLCEELIRLSREDAVYVEWVRSTAAAEAADRDQPPVIAPRPRRPVRWRHVFVAAAIATSVALLAVALSRPNRTHTDRDDPEVVSLEDVQGDVDILTADGAVRTARDGEPIYSGQEVRTGDDGSSTVIRVRDSRLVLAPETRVRVGSGPDGDADGPQVFVLEGMVAAEVADRPHARPVFLSSPHADVRGSAGKFSFVSLPDSTVIETDDGAARVTRKSDGKSIEVRRGQSAVAADNEPLRAKNVAARMTTPRRTLQDAGPVLGLFFDPAGGNLITCAGDAVKRWDLAAGTVSSIVTRPQKKKQIRWAATSLNGKLAALAHSDDKLVKVFELATGEERSSFKGLKRVIALALAPDSSQLAVSWNAGKEGHETRLYDTALNRERLLPTGHNGPVQALAYSPKGGLLATAADRSVKVWNPLSGDLIRSVTKLPAVPRALAFGPSGSLLAIGDRKGNIRVIEALTGSERVLLTGHLREISALAFSPDGQSLTSGAADGTAKVWNLADGREITTLKAHGNAISAVAYSRDGRTIVTGGWDRKLMFWDMPVLDME